MARFSPPLPGSSPLTRGKPVLTAALARCVGLIPAHAGKTHYGGYAKELVEAHPRSRGENALMSLGLWARSGSSPLTRGKPPYRSWWGAFRRLIPAHAGKTGFTVTCCTPPPAHPRSRGENPACVIALMSLGGSSPLTRGKPGAGRSPLRLNGLIPAHAGKTGSPLRRSSAEAAHPRSRGENSR